MSEGLKLNKKDRYLEKIGTGRVFIWTQRLAGRPDMRELSPEFDEAGSLIKRREVAEKMADLEFENAGLKKELERIKDPTMPQPQVPTDDIVADNDSDILPDEPLPDLEETFMPKSTGRVSEEFLMTKSADELRKFAFDVFGEKLNGLKKAETLVKDILDFQKQMDI